MAIGVTNRLTTNRAGSKLYPGLTASYHEGNPWFIFMLTVLESDSGQTVALGTQLIASAKGREAASPDDLCLKGVALGGPGCLSRWLKQQNPSWP